MGVRDTILLIVILVVMLAAIGLLTIHIGRHGGATTSTVAQNYTTTNGTAWLNQELVAWRPNTITPMNFGVNFATAGYAGIFRNNISAQYADLQMLNSTGAGTIRIDMDFDPWLRNDTANITKMDNLVAVIRADGRKLCIADAAAESYRQHKLPWAQFKLAWIYRVKTLASRYKPDCYIVVKEPGWYYGEISDILTNTQVFNVSDWINLTQNLVSAVHNVSPNTVVGVAVPGNVYHEKTSFDLKYFQQAVNVAGLSFIGFDIYGPGGFNDTMQFLNQTGTNGKNVWIAEAWSTTATYAFNASRTQIDAEWIKVLYYFALKEHAQEIVPFFTNFFSSYQQTITGPAYFSNRTPVYYAYKDIISTNKLVEFPT